MEELRVQGLAVSYSPAGPTAVVALHGAGNGTRDSSPLYRHLHETLPPLGIGVATFDRRGDGESEGEPTRGHYEAQARDGLAVAAALETRRLGLWGFSQGGWVAPLAATLTDDVAFVITIAANGLSPTELMLYGDRHKLEGSGYGPAVVERAAALRLQLDAWARDEGPAPDLAAAAGEPWFPLTRLPSSALDDEAKRGWIALIGFEPRAVFAAVRAPTLAFYGERDPITPLEPSVAAWSPRATLVVVPEPATA